KHALEGFFNSLRIELDDKIAILIVSPGWIKDTELKQRAVGNKIETTKENRQRKEGMSRDACTEAIITAIMQRKRELILPKKYRCLPWLKLMIPSLLDRILKRKI